jgi:hypothetical protein
MRNIWAWSVLGLYVAYAWIYFYGLDGADNYYWVNNDFFLPAFLVAAGAISVGALVFSWWHYRSAEPEDRSGRSFRPFWKAFILALLFFPYAALLALIAFLIDGFGV